MRHGQSVANAEGWLAGRRDVPLTQQGVAQAQALAETWDASTCSRALVSDLLRARQTADALLAGVNVPRLDTPRLRERHLGRWEGRPLAEVRADGSMDVLVSWASGPPEGESQRVVARRVLRFLAEQDDGTDTVVVCHGGVTRCITGLLDGLDLAEIGKRRVANCDPWVRIVAPGTFAALLENGP